MTVHVFGIRHHGPGSARSLRAALERLEPDVVLVEGPPDAAEVLPLIARDEMKPPVALLVYEPEAPQRACFYPFAEFSPEWQALRFAFERGIPARFIDLPQAVQLRERAEVERVAAAGESESDSPEAPSDSAPNRALDETAPANRAIELTLAGTAPALSVDLPSSESDSATPTLGPDASASGDAGASPSIEDDPIGALAAAAGYEDRELWWEHQIEQRCDATEVFDAILEAMRELRAAAGPATGREARREAHMRQCIRAAQSDGCERVAVVCGAWHAPLLASLDGAKGDRALLAGLSRVKVSATWIPWTYSRLSYHSGYGAGIASPGWYEHLWRYSERAGTRWIARVAGLLRSEDLDASPSNVIEAVRLAETLAALRGLPAAGFAELEQSVLTVLCGGDAAPLRLIRERLEIGDVLGSVPADAPTVPLQRDLAAQQRRLRLPASDAAKTYDLDLRNPTDRERSRLLYRLRLLGVDWGKPERAGGKVGTFHELWTLRWRPELEVDLVEASAWGNTVATAATARVEHQAKEATDLPALTELLDRAILADLPDAATHLLEQVQTLAAVAADVRHLMLALPPLARIARYGDVRETRADRVLPVVDALFERALVGLPGAAVGLDDDAAGQVVGAMGAVQEAVALLDRGDRRAEWQGVLHRLAPDDRVHGLVRGWACRLLLEASALDPAELQRLARLALSPVTPTAHAAAWIEGVLRGSGLLLLHQAGLWQALDGWLRDLGPDAFTELLPLVRRAFAGFQPPERRAMAEKVKRLGEPAGSRPVTRGPADELSALDHDRAKLVLPVLARVLGVRLDEVR